MILDANNEPLRVDRGQVVTLTAQFEEDPDEVHFVFMRPQEPRPIADPGYGAYGSRIVRFDPGCYAFAIDTTGFKGGEVWCHFWSVGAGQASWINKFFVNDAPPQLL